MIKFSHTVFALPFALTSVVLASRHFSLTWEKILWILLAMVGARSAAMGFNRIVDARFDSKNPRTAHREIPRGLISTGQAWLFVILASLGLVIAAYRLNDLCFSCLRWPWRSCFFIPTQKDSLRWRIYSWGLRWELRRWGHG